MKQLLFSLFLFFPLLSWGQKNNILLKRDTILVRDDDSIYYRKGDDSNGEIKYGGKQFSTVVTIKDGFISHEIEYLVGYKGNQKFYEYNFQNGLAHGDYYEWNEDNVLVIKGHYYKGYEDSIWTFYFSNGVKESEGAFLADSTKQISKFATVRNHIGSILNSSLSTLYPIHSPPHGKWNFYNRKGQRIKTFEFDKGVIKCMEFGDHLDADE